MNFKFFNQNKELDTLTFVNNHLILANTMSHTNNEFCYQFDDDEPVVFGFGNNDLTLTFRPTSDANMSFSHNNKTFKIFARERQ